MRLEEFKSLTEDELAMLWYVINKTTPPVLSGVELEPSVFCAIHPQAIWNRVDQIELAVKDEYKSIYDSLRQKLNMTPLEVVAPTIVPTQISGSEST
jgi:hypothetical protein